MRKLLTLVLCLVLGCCFAVTPALAKDNSWAMDGTEGNWQYTYLEDGTVGIVGYADQDYAGILTVPEQLGGGAVTSVSGLNSMKNVTEVVLPETVRTIEYSAFSDNSSMHTVHLPEGLVSIGEFAFHACHSLHHVQLPESLTEIHYGAFCDSNLEEIVIPESVVLIDNAAFGNNDILSVVFSGSSDVEIVGNPFYSNKVMSFTVPEDHPCLASYQGVLFNKIEKKLISYAYGRPGSAYEVPEGIRIIGEEAFEFSHLTRVVLPETLETIEDYAFLCCSYLNEIVIPDSVTYIGNSAFDNCRRAKSVHLGNGVTFIGEEAFAWCDNLETIEIGDNVQELGECAFAGSESLKRFVLRDDHPCLKLVDGVLFTRDGRQLLVYPGGKSATAYTVPEGTEIIAEYAFAYAGNLRSVTVPGTVKEVKNCAFSRMDNLEEVEFQDGVEILGEYLFSHDSKMKLLTIPKSVTTIHELKLGDDSSVVVRVWHDTPGAYQCLADNLTVEYQDEAQDPPAWLND